MPRSKFANFDFVGATRKEKIEYEKHRAGLFRRRELRARKDAADYAKFAEQCRTQGKSDKYWILRYEFSARMAESYAKDVVWHKEQAKFEQEQLDWERGLYAKVMSQ